MCGEGRGFFFSKGAELKDTSDNDPITGRWKVKPRELMTFDKNALTHKSYDVNHIILSKKTISLRPKRVSSISPCC